MKKIIIIIILFTAILLISNNSFSQPVMKTINDAQKIVENKQFFVGKSLSTLLQSIEPKIKMVMAKSDRSHENELGVFIFRFVEPTTYDSCKKRGVWPLQFTVFIQEPFEWNTTRRQKGKERVWTKEDEIKYGGLTVAGVNIYSKNN